MHDTFVCSTPEWRQKRLNKWERAGNKNAMHIFGMEGGGKYVVERQALVHLSVCHIYIHICSPICVHNTWGICVPLEFSTCCIQCIT